MILFTSLFIVWLHDFRLYFHAIGTTNALFHQTDTDLIYSLNALYVVVVLNSANNCVIGITFENTS